MAIHPTPRFAARDIERRRCALVAVSIVALPAAALATGLVFSAPAWPMPGACLNKYAACQSACDRVYGKDNTSRTGCGHSCFSTYNDCLKTNPDEMKSKTAGDVLQGGVQKGPAITIPGTQAAPKLQ